MNASSFSPNNANFSQKKPSNWIPLTGPLNETKTPPNEPVQSTQPLQPAETDAAPTFEKEFAQPQLAKTHEEISSQPNTVDDISSTQQPKKSSTKRATIKKVILIGLVVSFVAVLASGAMLALRAQNLLPSIQDVPVENTPMTDTPVGNDDQFLIPNTTESASPSADTISPMTTPAPVTISTADWQVHQFVNENLSISMPKTFSADSQNFIDKKEKLIRFWSKIDPSTAEMQIEIRSNWQDPSLQNLPRTFEISEGLMAAKVDPTSNKGEQQLSSYSTKYYFERNSLVYTFICRHEWEVNMYQTCEAALKTLKFNN